MVGQAYIYDYYDLISITHQASGGQQNNTLNKITLGKERQK